MMWFKKKSIDIKQIEKVEQELNIKLPSFFISFYKEHEALIRKLKKISNDEDYITLTTDFNWMITFNRDFHNLPRKTGLCKNKICIGSDGCGNDSFISLDENDKRVFKIDHEIANELIDTKTGDFNWEDDRMEKYNSLKQYLDEEIKILKQFKS